MRALPKIVVVGWFVQRNLLICDLCRLGVNRVEFSHNRHDGIESDRLPVEFWPMIPTSTLHVYAANEAEESLSPISPADVAQR